MAVFLLSCERDKEEKMNMQSLQDPAGAITIPGSTPLVEREIIGNSEKWISLSEDLRSNFCIKLYSEDDDFVFNERLEILVTFKNGKIEGPIILNAPKNYRIVFWTYLEDKSGAKLFVQVSKKESAIIIPLDIVLKNVILYSREPVAFYLKNDKKEALVKYVFSPTKTTKK